MQTDTIFLCQLEYYNAPDKWKRIAKDIKLKDLKIPCVFLQEDLRIALNYVKKHPTYVFCGRVKQKLVFFDELWKLWILFDRNVRGYMTESRDILVIENLAKESPELYYKCLSIAQKTQKEMEVRI